jgi:hypothetical protein
MRATARWLIEAGRRSAKKACRTRHFLKTLRILIAEKFSGECKSKKVTRSREFAPEVADAKFPKGSAGSKFVTNA